MGRAIHTPPSGRSPHLSGSMCRLLQLSNIAFHDSVWRGAPRAFWWWRAWWWMMWLWWTFFFSTHFSLSSFWQSTQASFHLFFYTMWSSLFFVIFYRFILFSISSLSLDFTWFLFQMWSLPFWFPIDFVF